MYSLIPPEEQSGHDVSREKDSDQGSLINLHDLRKDKIEEGAVDPHD